MNRAFCSAVPKWATVGAIEQLGDGEQFVARRRPIVPFETTERRGVGLRQSESAELDGPIDGVIAELLLADVPGDEVVEDLLLLVKAEVVEHRDTEVVSEVVSATASTLFALLALSARRIVAEPGARPLDERVHVGLDRSSLHGLALYCGAPNRSPRSILRPQAMASAGWCRSGLGSGP